MMNTAGLEITSTSTLSLGSTSMLSTSAIGQTSRAGMVETSAEAIVAILDMDFPDGSKQRIRLLKFFSEDGNCCISDKDHSPARRVCHH